MSRRISPQDLVRLRNHLPIREVLYALRVPWKQDDELCRFQCPRCAGMHTSVHPNHNLGRCFDCAVNYNPIDLVCAQLKVGFRSAVSWLLALEKLQQESDYRAFLSTVSRQSRVK